MNRLVAYLGRLSGSQRFRKEAGRDTLDEFRDELAAAWGDPEGEREVAWDLHLRVGRISGC